ncbi:PA14 domain-containing protein [Litoreibacter roseus]|uniref:PA14 domain-containing protein n=1 Tax=Litoreibacter roseus TaxID=2601869 RepID=A0A6N6JLB9_9RHOB|nr:PA14 domain-containing protein [Litoreibacter roseus]GFE66757.1 hypothetical protein KIN_38310 [Litoreibacter roseus]
MKPSDNVFGEGRTEQDRPDDKEQLADAFSRATTVTEEDQTRSALHYGSEENGTLGRSGQPGARSSGNEPWGRITPDTKNSEGDGGDSFPARHQSSTNDGSEPGAAQQIPTEIPVQIDAPEPAQERGQPESVTPADSLATTGSDITQSAPNAQTGALGFVSIEQPASDPQQIDDAENTPNRAPEQIELSNMAVAENASGAVVGTLSVIDPDADDQHSFDVSDDRFEVVDGALQLKPGISLDNEDAARIEVEVTVTDSAGASLTQSFALEVLEVPDVSIMSGFEAEYFDVDHRLSELNDIDWSGPPTHQEVTSEINYTNGRGSFWDGGSTDTFGVKISGNVEVEEAGSFTFLLGGDDGAMLFVNGEPVVNNDGLHGFRTRTGEIELEPGTHHIEVRYFENYGRAGLKLEWEGPGIDGRELVASPDQDALQTIGGIPLTVDLDIDQAALGPEDTVKLTALPEGTVVSAGDISITVDDAGVADLTGLDTHIMSITPSPDFVGQIDAEIIITVHDVSGQSARSAHPLTFDVNEANLNAPEATMVGGFKASYFDVDHSLREIADIDWDSDPTHQEFVQDINYVNGKGSFWAGGSTDTFGAKLEGQITVKEGGDYTFFAGGDDGLIVYINGEPLINNDGLHGFRTRSGEIDLEPGTYDIEVQYFENYGHAGLKLEWEGPDTEGRQLVTSDLDTAVDENATLEVGLDIGDASDAAMISIDGLPANTILHIGDVSIVTDGKPADLTGLDVEVLEISPPPGFEGVIEGHISLTDKAFNGAEVSTHTPYSLTVGDAEIASEQQNQDDDLLQQSGANQQGWDAEMDQSAEGFLEGDVMSESVPQHSSDEIAAVSTDTYERVDW